MTDPRDGDSVRQLASVLAAAQVPALVEDTPALDQDPQELVEQIVQALAQASPVVWEQLNGVFSIAGDEEVMQAVALTSRHSHSIPIDSRIAEMVRLHRRLAVGPEGPWLRLMFECDAAGSLRVGFDYGAVEPPPEHLLSGEAYLRDIERYPRANVPLWLLAHMGNDGRQLRSAADARTNAMLGIDEVRVADDDVPPLPVLWARIAVLAAVCRGSNAPAGPYTDPSFQRYVGDAGSCLLARLPGNRGALSGGRDDSRLLSAAYHGARAWPELYRGAPAWLHNLYLDPRAADGRLSFCYWWGNGHWYRAQVPAMATLSASETSWTHGEEMVHAVPNLWTAASTAEQVMNVLRTVGVESTEHHFRAALRLIAAAEERIASEKYVAELFAGGLSPSFDMAEAVAQLDAADVMLPAHPPIDHAIAVRLAADHCRDHGLGNWLDGAASARVDGGWKLYTPGEIRVDAPMLLVADDGVIESTTIRNAEDAFFGFAGRFAGRVRR